MRGLGDRSSEPDFRMSCRIQLNGWLLVLGAERGRMFGILVDATLYGWDRGLDRVHWVPFRDA